MNKVLSVDIATVEAAEVVASIMCVFHFAAGQEAESNVSSCRGDRAGRAFRWRTAIGAIRDGLLVKTVMSTGDRMVRNMIVRRFTENLVGRGRAF